MDIKVVGIYQDLTPCDSMNESNAVRHHEVTNVRDFGYTKRVTEVEEIIT